MDEVTAEQYEEQLDTNLGSLLERFKSGSYYAPPVKRVYIPKEAGGKPERPIGIPTLEDKVLQRAVVMLLSPVYEQDFLQCSYGFRQGRSAHQALEALWHAIMGMGGKCWVYEVDLKSCRFHDLPSAGLVGGIDLLGKQGGGRQQADCDQ